MPISPTMNIFSRYQCCFCGLSVVGEVPLHIVLDLPGGASQDLWVHGRCFGDRLHPSVPFLTPAEHLED